MTNLTDKQRNTLFLVNAINEIVEEHSFQKYDLEDVEFDCIGDAYFSLFHTNKNETIQLLKDILELADLGYIKVNYTAEELQEDDEIPLLLDETLYIKVVADTSIIKADQKVTEEAIEKVVNDFCDSEEIETKYSGKLSREAVLDLAKSIINNKTCQNIANILNALGSTATFVNFIMMLAKALAENWPYIQKGIGFIGNIF